MTAIHTSSETKIYLIFGVISILITLFLGFIDEGYYNFQFLRDPGAWIALGIYAVFMFIFQNICFWLLFKKVSFSGKIWVSAFLGPVLGFLFVIVVFFGIKLF
ncbi:hypothetical protein [Patiriisocius hiemis]|uniref:Uncharacterized protein n=1 Tax=Patiriisocius hiemis TaxID=3075604 RepID=A0ABU2YAA6_9FLAO|nr:hypothetical protein [Constantimarinum sp. W242]MDT0555125.1 hypothetical protein [Constantimarinum sp. W242]